MDILFSILIILIISFIMAFFSVKDLDFASDIKKLIKRRQTRGAIVFFEDGVRHFEHHSSSSSKSDRSAP
ncbi:hypothetical protein A3H83_03780 [Candidatus Roizmanbacteria bacterium RIFCSPLOWO2_02_FULL_39_8]|uniref:Uncharacterized protein n=1 Tax=Candidatus Roizmanbacteria bacterium RIFCSPHIGHO2_01_FULL_39_24 TaxID=1802032 RepID=A0A1F7GGM1_9BACT|nr:MAG: hypothetical protein A2799_04690 [Candidatus Roizmanbacteria bacterium RIFCSPHIGHO2_01_FULL_39_24]OGK56064.1 MAG: hypothetical protein A3H83_03780 [Candidatus Roizmanbacteria bacterium RIFCSPLOWO2_02_FULL_39_8]